MSTLGMNIIIAFYLFATQFTSIPICWKNKNFKN